jgi:hypothetical protein
MTQKEWEQKITSLLVGQKIVAVRYQTEEEMNDFDWYAKGLLIDLDDGTQLLVMQDDEGNGPGAIATSSEELPIIPVFH